MRLRDRPSETIDDVRQVNEELPSHYTGEHAEVGKALDDGYGLIEDPTHHFGTNPETDLPNSYNDQAEKYRRNETDCYWPESDPDGPVTNGMNSGSIENEYKIDNYIEKYGDRIDRVGDPGGKYFGAIDGDHVSSFSERSIDPRSACKPYYQYKLTGYWPEGYRIETGIVAPWHDSPGGARQVQIYNDSNRAVSAEEALKEGILRGDTNYDGLH
ncbi:TNT domain-containing protein [Arachnia propionica]|uniref:TNT domain-containing protein n=1 Tax=Arachnia propionica TaxID=1750 RepID=UPI0030CE7427